MARKHGSFQKSTTVRRVVRLDERQLSAAWMFNNDAEAKFFYRSLGWSRVGSGRIEFSTG
jgi:hypothetical protein